MEPYTQNLVAKPVFQAKVKTTLLLYHIKSNLPRSRHQHAFSCTNTWMIKKRFVLRLNNNTITIMIANSYYLFSKLYEVSVQIERA